MNDSTEGHGRERHNAPPPDIPKLTPEDIAWVQKHRKQEDAWAIVRAKWTVVREGIGTLIWILGIIGSIIIGINIAGDWLVKWLRAKGVG